MEKPVEKTKQQEQQKKQEQPKQQEQPKKQQQNEIQEVMQEIKDIKQHVGSNENDEKIVKYIVESICKKHATTEARLLEIERLRIESDKEFKKVAQQIEKERMEKEHSRDVMKMVWDGVKWIVVVAGVTVMYVFTNEKNKSIQIEKIRQGL